MEGLRRVRLGRKLAGNQPGQLLAFPGGSVDAVLRHGRQVVLVVDVEAERLGDLLQKGFSVRITGAARQARADKGGSGALFEGFLPSFNEQRTIHGGVRLSESGRFRYRSTKG
jgi:hypothetical protein